MSETAIRLSFFFGLFLLIALWEIISPRRELNQSKTVRWGNNLGLVILNSLILRLLLPVTAMGVAEIVESEGWGLFHQIEIPFVLAVVLSVILLDLAIYVQHVVVHQVPFFWRFHRLHHADLDYDVTTALRFHPMEILFSMMVKFAIIALLGTPGIAVLIFEIVLNGAAMFNHGNIKIGERVDQILRMIIVTPDMHRVHHSSIIEEVDSNYGFNLPWWDRLFGTYRESPKDGHLGMEIGLPFFREDKFLWIHWLLAMPILKIYKK